MADIQNGLSQDDEIQNNEIKAEEEISHKELAERLGIPCFDGSMSLKQYKKFVQQKLVMDKFVKDKDEFNLILRYKAYVEVFGNKKSPEYEYLRKQIWNCDGKKNGNIPEVDTLCKEQKIELQRYKAAFSKNLSKLNGDMIDKLVDSAAKEYENTGRRLPKDNDEAYNKALDSIYVYRTRPIQTNGYSAYIFDETTVDLRKTLCDDKNLNSNLSDYAIYVQNKGWKQKKEKEENSPKENIKIAKEDKSQGNTPEETEKYPNMDNLVKDNRSGHEKIAALRAKIAERKETERFGMSEDNEQSMAANHLLQLRGRTSEQTASSRPQAISADVLRMKMMQAMGAYNGGA